MAVVVIGGGLGGLSAALCLASRGREVVVLEGASELGGKAGRVVVDGLSFDTGPSVLTLLDVLDRGFELAGTRLTEQVRLRPVERLVCTFPEGGFEIGHGRDGFLDGVRTGLGPEAASEAASFLAYCERIWDAVKAPFVLGPAPSLGSLLALGPRSAAQLMRADPLRTMAGAIDGRLKHPWLRALFKRFATYNGSDPRRAPATLNCIAWVELGLGAYGIEGGLEALVDAYVRVLRDKGVELRTSAWVTGIERGPGGVNGVLVGEQRLAAEAVVCNADVRHLNEVLLPGSVSPGGEPSSSGWTALVRTPRQVARPAHQVVFHLPYEDEFRDLFDGRVPPENPTVYVCAQEVAHGRPGWDDDEALFVMVNVPAGCLDTSVVAARALDTLREHQVIAPSASVRWERDAAGLAARFPGSAGALYGDASNSRTAAFHRPANRTAVRGLYLASGTAHPGGGVPMVIQSGWEAARTLLEDQP